MSLHPEADRIAEANVRRWVLSQNVAQREPAPRGEEDMGPFITISREKGAGGSEIAAVVAKELGWDVLDRELVDVMADKYSMPHQVAELLDEKHPNWMEDLFATWLAGHDFSSSAYIHRLKRILLLAGQHGNVVIVGRGAQFVLPTERGLSVRILAPRDHRVQRIADRQGISPTEAGDFVDQQDRQHDEFVKEFLHHDSADPHVYDLVINVEKLSIKHAANLIVGMARSWLEQTATLTSRVG